MLANNATSSPSTVPGRQLGDELRRLREGAELTTVQAAEALDCTKGKISRIEKGRVAVRLPDLTAMLQAYRVSDTERRERLTVLARKANRRRRQGWWNVASRQRETGDEIEQFVEVRLARQQRLAGDAPLRLWAVLSEAVLLQQVGGPEVMKAQLQQLWDVSERPM
ncbi:Helix-turn-helix domain-containing protein [Streptomyces sp. cf386]|nr:Helix-turn-helix domain-containing protein [Streptomyces sp. cf386]